MKYYQELIHANVRLPSPPAIAIKILDTVRRDDFSFKDLARIIETDPALVAKILRVANSSYYSFSRKVGNIETAISILGTHAVKNIALSFVIYSDLKRSENKEFDLDLFWRRAITTAVAAEQTAALVGSRSPDIFVTALLQDIGVIIFIASVPERYQLTMNENLASRTPLHELERECFGFDHQVLGGELLQSWRLPDDITIPIRHHHQQELIPEGYRVQVEILQIADALSAIYHGKRSVAKLGVVREKLKSSFAVEGEQV
ncbi:MAG TPA: HDOD domain-containing protein, partial [Geobacteraceae bacterium]